MRRTIKYKVVIYCCCAIITFLIFRYFSSKEIDWDSIAPDDDIGRPLKKIDRHDKWIVVTTTNMPTSQIYGLSKIPGWKMVVVGDRKTPKNWMVPGVIFLDTAAQKALRYKVHKFLPYDSYTRKAIGYLYAIEHGATFIYETDDDNVPYDNLKPFQTSHSSTTGALVVNTKNTSFNPYPHFGQSSLWPRGYPLDHIGESQPRQFKACTTGISAIQQGLVNGDPDVDALFRLTRKHNSKDLDLKFDTAAPAVVLPRGKFAPYNSQNTLITARAFWSLLLPTTVSMRACDIYRGYWAQRLLWLLGSNLAFYPPNSHQTRNPHSYVKDAVDEAEIYEHTGQFIDFLSTWKCTKVFLFDCMRKLTEDMVVLGLLERRDLDLMDAWITDLATIGYVPPAMKQYPGACMSSSQTPVTFYPWEQNTTMFYNAHPMQLPSLGNKDVMNELMITTCGATTAHKAASAMSARNKETNVLLVISIRGPEEIGYLTTAYSSYIPHILFCGDTLKDESVLHRWKASFVSPAGKPTATTCLKQAVKLHYNVAGYFHVSSAMLLRPWRLSITPSNSLQVWVMGDPQVSSPDRLKDCDNGKITCRHLDDKILNKLDSLYESSSLAPKMKTRVSQCLKKISQDENIRHKTGVKYLRDLAFYLPERLSPVFLDLSQPLNEKHNDYEFVALLVMECLELLPEYMSVKDVEEKADENQHIIFPFHVDQLTDETVYRKTYCEHLLHASG